MWLMYHWSQQSEHKPNQCNVHNKLAVREKSWDLVDLIVRDWVWFWAPLCARALPLPSIPSKPNAQHTCQPGHSLELRARARLPVGIPMTTVPNVWCPLFAWADTRMSGCTEGTLKVKIFFSFIQRTNSASSHMAEVRMNQPFVFMVGYFCKKSQLLRTRRKSSAGVYVLTNTSPGSGSEPLV